MSWIYAKHVFDGRTLHGPGAIRVSDGRVQEFLAGAQSGAGTVHLITPGFVDLQVNGGGGELINANPTPEAMARVASVHRRFGTVGILPTVITDEPSVLARATAAVIEAHGADGIVGLHIEGPHIAEARRGTHAAKFIRPLDSQTLMCVESLRAADVPVILTLAPEAATHDQIKALAGMGAVVSLGHSDATYEDACTAFAAGATLATHVFNAMSPLQSRAPGVVGATLECAAFAGIICDGVHVHDASIRLAARAMQGDLFAVSDAMPTVGGPDSFDLYGATIHRKGDHLVNDESRLAGAHTTLAVALERLVNSIGVPLETALQMVVTTPASAINCPSLSRLVGQSANDVFIVSDNLRFIEPISKRI